MRFAPHPIPFVQGATTEGRAIQPNDEFLARGAEINDVIPNGMLVAKMNPVHAMCPSPQPELGLRFVHIAEKLLGISKGLRGSAFMHGEGWERPNCSTEKRERKLIQDRISAG